MKDFIYYKISNTTIYSSEHFYKMFRFVWFKTFVICVDIYQSELNISLLIAYNNLTKCSKSFNLLRIK